MSVVFFRGRNCTLVPRQVQMNVVIGKPLQVPRVEDPAPELVERIHQEYVNRLQSLFDRHKGLHPEYKDCVLEMQ